MSIANSSLLPPLIYRGSVKNVRGLPAADSVVFEYSDRYSVFDWGEMPDDLAGKGAALAVLTDVLYRRLGAPWGNWSPKFSALANSAQLPLLQKKGLRHHGQGLVQDSGAALPMGAVGSLWKVEACERKLPEFKDSGWDYSWYNSEAKAIAKPLLVPLEVVFRFGVPEGSSYLKREPKHKPGSWLETPVVEYFSKLEPTDRFLSVAEAMRISGLNQEEECALRETSLLLACRIRDWFAEQGLSLWDGKFEFAFVPHGQGRTFALVDAIGPDELRLTNQQGIHVSKEILRKFYRPTAWYQAVERAKIIAAQKNDPNWKDYCKLQPQALPGRLREIIAEMYQSLTNQMVGETVFSRARQLPQVLSDLARELP